MPDNRKTFVYEQREYYKLEPDPDPKKPDGYIQKHVSQRIVGSGQPTKEFTEWIGYGTHSFVSLIGMAQMQLAIPCPNATTAAEAFAEADRRYPEECKKAEEQAKKEIMQKMAEEKSRILVPGSQPMPGKPPMGGGHGMPGMPGH